LVSTWASIVSSIPLPVMDVALVFGAGLEPGSIAASLPITGLASAGASTAASTPMLDNSMALATFADRVVAETVGREAPTAPVAGATALFAMEAPTFMAEASVITVAIRVGVDLAFALLALAIAVGEVEAVEVTFAGHSSLVSDGF